VRASACEERKLKFALSPVAKGYFRKCGHANDAVKYLDNNFPVFYAPLKAGLQPGESDAGKLMAKYL